MSIEKFEVGKKYRFLKDGDGDSMYCGVDAKAGQEFVVSMVVEDSVITEDVTYKGESGEDSCGWVVCNINDTHDITTLNDFEEVVGNLGTELDTKHTLSSETEESTNTDLIQQMITLQQEHKLMLMFHGGEVIINFENNDTEYKISSQKELTTLIEASNVLKSFERK